MISPWLWWLIAAQVCVHAGMAGLRMAAPLWVLRAGYGESTVGFVLALFAISQVFLALPAGRLIARRGLHGPHALGAVGLALALVAVALWPGVGLLCLAAVASGAATGITAMALQRRVGQMASDRTGLKQVFSWLAIGPALSNFLGPVQAGLLIDTWGFSAAFASLAILPLLSWWLVSRTPREPMAAQGSNVSTHTAVLNLLADAGFRRLLLINWLLSVCWDVHTFVVPVLGHERGLSASVIGGLLGVFAVAAVCVRVLMPWVAASLREVQVLAVAMLITVLVYCIYPLLETAASMAAASACLGLALGTVQPMIMSMLHMQVPATRLGEALALRLMFINASSVLMPVALGLAGAAVGVAALFWVTAATVVGGLPLVKALGVAEPPSDRTLPSE